MSLPILTAVTDAVVEADLVTAFGRRDLGVSVVRRCVDLADLLAAASAVLLSADLRRLDREALVRLASAGLAVVGIVTPGDEEAERRLRQLGVAAVVASDAAAEVVSAAVVAAVHALPSAPPCYSEPLGALPRLAPLDPDQQGGDPSGAGLGHLLAVWGPTGAPGRTTVAAGLAAELAGMGLPTLLVDADVYGGAVASSSACSRRRPGSPPPLGRPTTALSTCHGLPVCAATSAGACAS